ncbi:hypothetical protein ACFLT7_07485 [candidate division KSB1 bacterium]
MGHHMGPLLLAVCLLSACGGGKSTGLIPGTMDIEAKMALEPAEELSLHSGEDEIEISGQTFTYTIDRRSGLISGIEVLDETYNRPADSRPFPDTYLTPEKDPGTAELWSAANERAAEVRILKSEPDEVVIQAEGRYRNSGGESYPVSFRITYQIFIDGVTFVHVLARAEEDTFLRYLVLNQGAVPAEKCRYISHLPDLALQRGSGGYRFEKLTKEEGRLLGGLFLPWFWVGSERTGVEITTWDVNEQHSRPVEFRHPGGQGMGDFLGSDGDMFIVERKDGLIRWTNFALRNAASPVGAGWEIDGRFALGITPPKTFKSKYLELRPAPPLGWGDEESIRKAAVMGANYMEGGMRGGGDGVPFKYPSADSVIASYNTYDKYGIRAIPYSSLTDLAEDDPMFIEHGPDWVLEPGYGYQYRTTGICPSVPEWRDYFNASLDKYIDSFPVDGIYHDMWYGMLACENFKHGCDTRFRRIGFPWLRDMLAHSYNSIHRKDPDNLMFHNLNVCNIAMISSFCDIRLVGESRDITRLDPTSRYGLYNSYRLGSQTAWSTYGSKDFGPEKEVTFGLLIGSLLPRHPAALYRARRGQEDGQATVEAKIALRWKYYNIFRFFEAAESTWHPALAGQELVTADGDEVYVNAYQKPESLLLTITNMEPKPVRTRLRLPDLTRLGLRPAGDYQVYDPVNHSLVGDGTVKGAELDGLRLSLGDYGHRVLHITPVSVPGERLLFGLGLDGVEAMTKESGGISFIIDAPESSEVELAFYSPKGKPESVTQDGRKIESEWSRATGIALARLNRSEGGKMEIIW